MKYDHIEVPADGEAIVANPDHSLIVPDNPIIPFVEGDGIGIDVTPVMLNVAEAAVEQGLWRQAAYPLDARTRRSAGRRLYTETMCTCPMKRWMR